MSYPINYPTPQNANVQIFYALRTPTAVTSGQTWTKPQGASFVWFTLIGSGGCGDGSNFTGGSGAVTNFMCPAFLIPDTLNVFVGTGAIYSGTPIASTPTSVQYRTKDSIYSLLSADGGGIPTGAPAMTANPFTAIGFFQSIAGQAGASGAVSASPTTFLAGGGTAAGQSSNYGYTTNAQSAGFFQMQPIIVGAGGTGNSKSGIGCGGGLQSSGGNGLCVIITW